jgi:hypothetical protein
MKKRFTEAQIAFALRQAASGADQTILSIKRAASDAPP